MSDEHFYAAALNELESNQANKDLLAKALVKASGDQTRQKSEYIKLRASQLSIAAKTSENSAMAKAMDFYNAKRYSDSVHGLTLLMKRKGDARAMVCFGNIYLHGVEGHPSDTRLAMELLASAERSKNADVRRFLGEILEPLGDWKRTLVNYDFAAKAGNERAKHLAAALRSRLEETGVTG